MNELIALARDDVLGYLNANGKLMPASKKKYKQVLTKALDSGATFDKLESVIKYWEGLTPSNQRLFKSAIRAWGKGIETRAKLSATPENVHAIQATIWRLEGISSSLETPEITGQKPHTWLTFNYVIRIYAICSDDTNKCKRDRILFGLMCGAGLRRDELVKLRFKDIIKQPIANGKVRHTLDVQGKGNKRRAVPIRPDLAEAMFQWREIVGVGSILRSVNKGDSTGKSLSGSAISKIVTNVGIKIGQPNLAPHDLRRTFARLAYNNGNGVDLEQLRIILGHKNVTDTQKYVNAQIDLERAPCDYTPPVL